MKTQHDKIRKAYRKALANQLDRPHIDYLNSFGGHVLIEELCFFDSLRLGQKSKDAILRKIQKLVNIAYEHINKNDKDPVELSQDLVWDLKTLIEKELGE
jgi:hypothetical protein